MLGGVVLTRKNQLLTFIGEAGDIGGALDRSSKIIQSAAEDNKVTSGETAQVEQAFKDIGKEIDEAKTALFNIFKKTGTSQLV